MVESSLIIVESTIDELLSGTVSLDVISYEEELGNGSSFAPDDESSPHAIRVTAKMEQAANKG